MARHAAPPRRAPRRPSILLLGAGLAAAVVLAFAGNGTLSAYTAAFENAPNTASTAAISMQQGPTSASQPCASTETETVTCGTDLYSAKELRPGDTNNGEQVVFTNTGSVTPSLFTLRPGSCNGAVATPNTMCNFLIVSVTWTTSKGSAKVIDAKTAMAIANTTFTVPAALAPAPNEQGTVTVTVTLDPAAPNDSQRQSMNQSLLWTFTA